MTDAAAAVHHKVVREQILRDARPGTEWTADGAGYGCAIGDEELIWYDQAGILTREPYAREQIADIILSHFGLKAKRCDGALNATNKETTSATATSTTN